jgi:hypothetical protein
LEFPARVLFLQNYFLDQVTKLLFLNTGSTLDSSSSRMSPFVVGLHDVCDEILLHILAFLPAEDLARSSCISLRFRRITRDESLWRALHYTEWGYVGRPGSSSWRYTFIKQRELKRNWDMGKYSMTCLAGHTNRISAVQFDENFILSASWDGTAILRDARTYQYVSSFSGHTDRVNAVQFNSEYALTAGDDRIIILHTIAEGHIFRMYGSHGGGVTSIRWIGDNIVSGCNDRGVYLWNFEAGTLQQTVFEHKAPVLCVDANDDTIASGSEDFSVRVRGPSLFVYVVCR